MPNYKTHSIHGDLIFPEIDKQIEINREDLKLFCMGPDAMVLTDYKTFDYQHAHRTKAFFLTMLKLIKSKKLLDNSEAMAFLYGQLNHFILDMVMHPLIYYMTEDIARYNLLKPHALVENWIDDYTIKKHHKNQLIYYRKMLIKNKELKKLINEIYRQVYGVRHGAMKYSIGMFSTVMYDFFARRNAFLIAPLLAEMINMGDVFYKNDVERVLPFLNLDKKMWLNPETGEEYHSSFDDLWKKSMEMVLETIKDVNNYLYQDKTLNNPIILDNISYNTGLPCEEGQKLQYIKKYK